MLYDVRHTLHSSPEGKLLDRNCRCVRRMSQGASLEGGWLAGQPPESNSPARNKGASARRHMIKGSATPQKELPSSSGAPVESVD